MKRTVDRYIDAGYCNNTINRLSYLESHTEHLDDLLEDYRHLQPGGAIFTEGMIGVIYELFNLEQIVSAQQQELMILKDQIENFLLKLPLLTPTTSLEWEEGLF